MFHELQPLTLSSGKHVGRLSHLDVSESDIYHELKIFADMVDLGEEFQSIADIHVEHFGDSLSSPLDTEYLRLVSFAVAEFARDVGVRQKLQFHFLVAVAVTGRA